MSGNKKWIVHMLHGKKIKKYFFCFTDQLNVFIKSLGSLNLCLFFHNIQERRIHPQKKETDYI